ncbi:hypothetical protein ACLI4Q_17215 [Natrialbaceae archaeon A-CW1-1]
MEGEGGHATGERTDESPAFDLGRALAGLNGEDEAARTGAVETIRQTVDEHPERCLPTVPKLRAILTDPASSTDVQTDVAYCLERLATESAGDVAPSVPAIVSYLATESTSTTETTDSLLMCIERVADHRPRVVAEHLETLQEADIETTTEQRWPLTEDTGEEGEQRPATDAVSESTSH